MSLSLLYRIDGFHAGSTREVLTCAQEALVRSRKDESPREQFPGCFFILVCHTGGGESWFLITAFICQRSAFSGHGPSQRRSLETGPCWLLEIIKLSSSWASVFQIFLKHFLTGFKCLPCLWQFPPYIPLGSESAIPFSIAKCGGY